MAQRTLENEHLLGTGRVYRQAERSGEGRRHFSRPPVLQYAQRHKISPKSRERGAPMT
jgi:hypothetical protein